MESRTVSLRNGLFSVELRQSGSGEPLLFLHGSGGVREGRYLDMLAQRFTVYAPSHPGFGESDVLEPIHAYSALPLFYHDPMDELGWESAHLLCPSLGCCLAP